MQVAVRGDDAELTLTTTFHFDTNFLAFGLRYRLARTAQGWRVREVHAWPLAAREPGRRAVYDAATWTRLDREADRLRGGADRLAHLRALKEASRWRELFEAAEGAAEAEALALRGEAAHRLGRIDDALAAFRAAEASRPDVEFPWYMTRLRQHFRGHGKKVYGVAYHPDGRHVLSAGEDSLGRLWDADTSQEIQRFEGGEGHISSVALSPDGKTTATGGNVLRLFDVETAKPLHECRGHRERVYRVVFSPDGMRLVSASADHTARVWEVATGKEVLTLQGHGAEVLGAVFSPDGKTIATASRDKTAKLWDAATGTVLRTFTGHEDRLVRVAFRPDGARIVTTSHDRTVRLWDVATGKEVRKLDGHSAYVEVALFSPDGTRVASADGEGVILVHDAETGKLLLRLHETAGTIYGLSFRGDGKVLAAAGRDGVFLWDVTPGNEGEVLDAGGTPR
jgi:DNA-binding beta-propeller fold protein YncE